MEFINSTTGWVCGDNGVILKTTNGGVNWIQQPTEAIGKYLFGIYPVNENVVYCAGWFETILKTTNGGTNWITLQNGPVGLGHSYFSVFFLNENTGWIGSTNTPLAKVMKTTDGGLNWSDNIMELWLYDIYFKDSLNGIGVGEASYYCLTSNGGVNWVLHSTERTGDFRRISILNSDKNKGFIVSSNGMNVYKTTNFGTTFDSVGYIPDLQTPYSIYCSEFINDSIGWAGGTYGLLYKTENGGRTWRAQNSLSNAFIANIYAMNDSVAWLCGAGGKLLHTTNGGDTITAIRQISTILPDDFQLFQNYPNPFNSMCNVQFSMYNAGNVKLVVYDVQGREVQTLVNETLKPGTYVTSFDGSMLNSGVYFYKLVVRHGGSSTNSFSETKKMLLVK
jgi:photosystem II stability/assembly factor-like uncharacterized protein